MSRASATKIYSMPEDNSECSGAILELRKEQARTRHLIDYMANKTYPHTIDKVLKGETTGCIENYFVHIADQPADMPNHQIPALPPGFNNIARYNPSNQAWALVLEW